MAPPGGAERGLLTALHHLSPSDRARGGHGADSAATLRNHHDHGELLNRRIGRISDRRPSGPHPSVLRLPRRSPRTSLWSARPAVRPEDTAPNRSWPRAARRIDRVEYDRIQHDTGPSYWGIVAYRYKGIYAYSPWSDGFCQERCDHEFARQRQFWPCPLLTALHRRSPFDRARSGPGVDYHLGGLSEYSRLLQRC